ncbi:female fertility-7 [Trichoderma gamsii]|uniref:Female fertility-7 n=1 Tax=Trichoderma gamsii TaxID=398673 RepID=A0A2P4ZPM3_9HYPO|nr:female fertility-7 [Trichoderma gamsii]PON26241.1 female fertility-7 [Trichoderma gamsii]
MDTIVQAQNTFVHPTSLLDSNCILGHNVKVGPFCHVGSNVTIGDGTELVSNVTILSSTSLGKKCKVYPFAVLGGPPQDKKYSGENTTLVIGNKTIIREFVSIHTGTAEGDGVTRVGNQCYIMTNVHVGHDCQIDDDVVLATGAGLAGHVSVGRGAIVSGQAGIHQFCRIGQLAFVGGGSMVTRDVLPFSTVIGNRAMTVGLNDEGLRRREWSSERISVLRTALVTFLNKGEKGLESYLKQSSNSVDVQVLLDFIKGSARNICPPKADLKVKLDKL